MSVQLHVPYSEHAKAPVGPITMGLPLAMDPKKLGKDLGPLPRWPGRGSSCPRWGLEGRVPKPGPWVGLGGGRRPRPLHLCCVAHRSHPSPAPFSGVKQEQLSPRGQAGPPENLGVPTAQETSVLRGEGVRGGREARILPCVPSGCPSALWRRVEAGTGTLIPNLRIISSHRVQNPVFLIVYLAI